MHGDLVTDDRAQDDCHDTVSLTFLSSLSPYLESPDLRRHCTEEGGGGHLGHVTPQGPLASLGDQSTRPRSAHLHW